jgi:hypothetical protein
VRKSLNNIFFSLTKKSGQILLSCRLGMQKFILKKEENQRKLLKIDIFFYMKNGNFTV